MAKEITTSCVRTLPVGPNAEPRRHAKVELLDLTRRPWHLHIGRTPLVVRPGTVRDLSAVAQLHRRCSARSLLDRYRRGGRSPAGGALDAELRNPFGYVAETDDGTVVATAAVRRDPRHGPLCAEAAVLVADAWQQRGLGRELVSHLAGVAQVAGFAELVAYPATAVPVAQRLLVEIGRTRMVPDADPHLHTRLAEGAALGLGSVRQRLAG